MEGYSLINVIEYYDDEPELLKTHEWGLRVHQGCIDSFTGIVEIGGKYQDTEFYIDGHRLNHIFWDGVDMMESLVKEAISSIAGIEFDSLPFPKLPPKMVYNFEGDFPSRECGENPLLIWSETVDL